MTALLSVRDLRVDFRQGDTVTVFGVDGKARPLPPQVQEKLKALLLRETPVRGRTAN